MKKIITILTICAALIGCGDDVTNINGYTDEEVKALIDSSLSSQDIIVMSDTVYQQTVDTIYNMVIDTVTNELVDTIYQRVVDTVTTELVDTIYTRVVDTVMNELVDTIYQRVVDTVYHELVDTIYQKVIDTVFTELEKVGIDVSKPRDTTITFSDTTDGIITSKTYKGVVYKGVFYEAHEYGYGVFIQNIDVIFYPFGNLDISESGNRFTVYYYDQCGAINKPDYKGFAWRDVNSIKRFPGWRMFNDQDAYEMAQYLNMIVSDTALVYLNTLSYEEKGRGNLIATIAKYKVPNTTSRYEDREKLKYVCAYDLQ